MPPWIAFLDSYPLNSISTVGRVLIVDIKRDIQQRIGDELADVGLLDVPIEYHMTSIFDHSIFEAFSKIIQKLIPQLHTLQDLLNNLVDVSPRPLAHNHMWLMLPFQYLTCPSLLGFVLFFALWI